MTWLLTHSGRTLDLTEPDASLIVIEDIAASLSKQCRFLGHCRGFYSVAQHSLLVARILADFGAPAILQLSGLLHDAHEAYTGDITSPVQAMLDPTGREPRLKVLQRALDRRIAVAFGGVPFGNGAVKHADLVALATEKRDLLPDHAADWPCLAGITPHAERIVGREWWAVAPDFLAAFTNLHAAAERDFPLTTTQQ